MGAGPGHATLTVLAERQYSNRVVFGQRRGSRQHLRGAGQAS
jgi:hypothetical protein